MENIELSLATITNHFDKVENNNSFSYKIMKNQKDFTANSLKRNQIKNKDLNGYNFSQASFAGSIFHNISFVDCNFKGAIAEFCDFYNCSFKGELLRESLSFFNFNNSNFINCCFNGLEIITSSCTNSLFKNTQFSNCIITLSSFENATFDNVLFSNIDLSEVNIEFADFKKIRCDKVILPIAQVCYIFGALEYILNTEDNIRISSNATNLKSIEKEDFIRLLPDLINYYISIKEFFPLANIYISLGEGKKALQAIYDGIFASAKKKDFRMLKFYCKLAVSNYWLSKEKRFEIYETITTLDQQIKMSSAEAHNFYLHLGEFRKILLFSNNDSPTLYYNIKSNIENHEYNKLSITIKSIEDIINEIKDEKTTYSIELRHESPFSILIMIVATAQVIGTVCYCINKICSTIKEGQDIYINQQIIKKNSLEIESLERKAEEEKATLNQSKIILSGTSYYTNLD